MIKINLLRETKSNSGKKFKFKFPAKTIIILAAISCIGIAGFYIKTNILNKNENKDIWQDNKIVRKTRKVKIKRKTTPFNIQENTVDEIYGGRFKIKDLIRLSSPENLSVNEKKFFEKFYIKNLIDIINSAVYKFNTLGFSSLSFDNTGNIYIHGLTKQKKHARKFRENLDLNPSILEMTAVKFKESKDNKGFLYTVKGYINYNIINKIYSDDSWDIRDRYSKTSKNVLQKIYIYAKKNKVKITKKKLGSSTSFGKHKKYKFEMSCSGKYGNMVNFIEKMYTANIQIGYKSLNILALRNGLCRTHFKMYIYSDN